MISFPPIGGLKKSRIVLITLLGLGLFGVSGNGCSVIRSPVSWIHGDPGIEVRIETDPPGAEVSVDGRIIGTSPVIFHDDSGPQKSFKVEIKKAGLGSVVRTIERKWDTMRLTYRLDPVYFYALTPLEESQTIVQKRTKPRSLSPPSRLPTTLQPEFSSSIQSQSRSHLTETGIDFGNYYALVIGNNEYPHLPNLKTAVHDAETLANLLQTDYGFHVTPLINATREEIVMALDQFRATLTEHDNLLIYYAGHGIIDEATGRGYWLPVNATDDTRTNWVATYTITDTLKAMSAKHVMVVADSCYSGTIVRDIKVRLKTGAGQDDYLRRMLRKRARTALTSGGLEPVLDQGRGGHSIFASILLETLKENKGILEGHDLFGRIKRPVMMNAEQTPEYGDIRFAGHEGGDFLFVRRPTEE